MMPSLAGSLRRSWTTCSPAIKGTARSSDRRWSPKAARQFSKKATASPTFGEGADLPWERNQVRLAQKILDRYAGTYHLMIQPKGSLCARRADGTITAKRVN